MSQIQGLIASALQAERTQHEADMTAMRDQLAQVKKDLATAEVRIDDRSALGTAEEARIANVVSTALVASTENRYRGQVSPKLPIGFITCMEEHPFDPSRMVYLVRKIQETLYSIVGAPHLLDSPFSYESYVYGSEFVLELHQELFKDLVETVDYASFRDCHAVVYGMTQVTYLSGSGAAKLRTIREKLLSDTNSDGAMKYPKLTRANREGPGFDESTYVSRQDFNSILIAVTSHMIEWYLQNSESRPYAVMLRDALKCPCRHGGMYSLLQSCLFAASTGDIISTRLRIENHLMQLNVGSIGHPLEKYLPMASEVLRFLYEYGAERERIVDLKAMVLDRFLVFLRLYAIPHSHHGPDIPSSRVQFIEAICTKVEILRQEATIIGRPGSLEFETLKSFQSYDKVEDMLRSLADLYQLDDVAPPASWSMPEMNPGNGHAAQAALKDRRTILSSSTYGDNDQAKRVMRDRPPDRPPRPIAVTTDAAARSFGRRSMLSRGLTRGKDLSSISRVRNASSNARNSSSSSPKRLDFADIDV